MMLKKLLILLSVDFDFHHMCRIRHGAHSSGLIWHEQKMAVRTSCDYLGGPKFARTNSCRVSGCPLNKTSTTARPKAALLCACKHVQQVVVSSATWLWSSPDLPAASRPCKQRDSSTCLSSALLFWDNLRDIFFCRVPRSCLVSIWIHNHTGCCQI